MSQLHFYFHFSIMLFLGFGQEIIGQEDTIKIHFDLSVSTKEMYPEGSFDYLFDGFDLQIGDSMVHIDSLGLYSFTFYQKGKYNIERAFIRRDDYMDTSYFHLSPLKLKVKKEKTVPLVLECDCYKNDSTAFIDFKNNRAAFISIFGFIGPPVDEEFISIARAFIEKYNVFFNTFGCEVDLNSSCAEAYNLRLAKLMDAKYGKAWRDELPWRVLGLEYKGPY